jgi:hypothetical protein
LEEKYKKEMMDCLEFIKDLGFKKWEIFYEKKVFANTNKLYNVYKIRLLLLNKWREKWM